MRRIAITTNRVLCYGPTRLFKPPDTLAMHKFGHRQSSATTHQWIGEWSATYASNRHASPRHRDIEKNFIACIEIFSRCFDAKYHQRYIAEQRRAVGEHSAMYTKAKNVPDTSATHRRHIGDTSATNQRCSCKHRQCIFDVITSPMVWWSIADPSPMFPSCSAKHRRSYGDASLSVRNLPSNWSLMITWAPL